MRYRQGGGQSSRSTVRFRVSEPVFHTHPWLMARVMALSWVRFSLTITAWDSDQSVDDHANSDSTATHQIKNYHLSTASTPAS